MFLLSPPLSEVFKGDNSVVIPELSKSKLFCLKQKGALDLSCTLLYPKYQLNKA